ncbi:MAG: histidine kinase dimerization/phosphoacceptor domain -containing protein [Acetobacterium sp.]|nr:histidine kinase dimerization/phosphoacceptor domain -containing protein [Acetobacterium sp.]
MISVLYVDDEESLLEIGKLYLEKNSEFHIRTTNSGKDAFEILKHQSFDVIISDYQMPEIDGIKFLKMLRSSGNTAPFIIFTGRGREEIVIEALNNGADFYLQKGGDPKSQFAELESKIMQAVLRRQAEKSLRERDEEYRNVVETQTEFICRFKPDGTHIFANEAYCRYFGKLCSEIVGKKFKPRIPSEDQESIRKHFVSLTPDHPLSGIEHRIIMPDGSVCWQRWIDRAFFSKEGVAIEYQSVGRDVTDVKHAEQQLKKFNMDLEQTILERTDQLHKALREKEHLIFEIHHRLKNNLQVVWGLIDLQLHSIKDTNSISALQECQNRVCAMALIHDSLCRAPDLSRIDFSLFLENLSNKLLDVYQITGNRVKVSIASEAINLDNYIAIPCGLIVNELVSNVLKHALPNGRQGRISIGFQLKDSMYTLSFSDDGIGIPCDIDLATTESMGLKLVNLLATDQLDGTIQLDQTNGTRFIIRFPKKEPAPIILEKR